MRRLSRYFLIDYQRERQRSHVTEEDEEKENLPNVVSAVRFVLFVVGFDRTMKNNMSKKVIDIA
jgi:hypothetical protein